MLMFRFKKILLEFVAFVLFYSRTLTLFNHFVNGFQSKKNDNGKFRFPYVKRRHSRNIQILVYHRVNDEQDPFFPATPVKIFGRQMDYLASHFNVLDLDEAIERLKKKDVIENAVVITFDDGYKDNYVIIFPILKRLSIPVTIFLPTASIGSEKPLWHDRVFSAFRNTQVSVLRNFSNSSKVYPLGTTKEKFSSLREVSKFLWSLDNDERSLWIDRLIKQLGVSDESAVEPLLTWDDVKEMHQNGISFGSHTVTHSILSRLPLDEVKAEVYESKKIIEEKIGSPVRTFAYPVGRKEDFNEITKNLLKEAGYTCALTTIFGANDDQQDLFELRRGMPWEEYLPAFVAKMNWYKFYY